MFGSGVHDENSGLKTVLEEKYCLDKPIGSGGMGIVYRAVHRILERQVAIKLLRPTYAENPRVVSRFHLEARAAASIGHDNICEVYDVGTSADGALFLVMPLLDGAPLSRLISEEEISLKRVVDIVSQTLAALDAAHRAHIVHCDLKPDNIFVTQIGDRKDFVKLLDFGISRVLDQREIADDTITGAILGTPHYMSPEQARGKRQIDHRVDIYATGVILYETLTGRRPFFGKSRNDILFNIITAPFPPPRSVAPSIPPDVEKVILKAMARDPLQRFESADTMRLALEKAIDDRAFSTCVIKSEKQSDPQDTIYDIEATQDGVYITPLALSGSTILTVLFGALFLLLVLLFSSQTEEGTAPQQDASVYAPTIESTDFIGDNGWPHHNDEHFSTRVDLIVDTVQKKDTPIRKVYNEHDQAGMNDSAQQASKETNARHRRRRTKRSGLGLWNNRKKRSGIATSTEDVSTIKGAEQTLIYTVYE
jgi:serine/threonine protein kinase